MKESSCFPRSTKPRKSPRLGEASHAEILLPQILKMEKFFLDLIGCIDRDEISVTPGAKYLCHACYSKVIRLRKGLEKVVTRKNF
jgi:hypothetical protein